MSNGVYRFSFVVRHRRCSLFSISSSSSSSTDPSTSTKKEVSVEDIFILRCHFVLPVKIFLQIKCKNLFRSACSISSLFWGALWIYMNFYKAFFCSEYKWARLAMAWFLLKQNCLYKCYYFHHFFYTLNRRKVFLITNSVFKFCDETIIKKLF